MSSQENQDLLPQPGIEDSFHKMLLVRFGKCRSPGNLHLRKSGNVRGSVKGKKAVMIDRTKLGLVLLMKSLLSEEIKGIKHIGETPTLSHLHL